MLYCKLMNTETFSVHLDRSAKARLQKLAKSTGRSGAFLAAEAISAYLDTNEWQVATGNHDYVATDNRLVTQEVHTKNL